MNAFSILRDAWYFYHRHVTSLALLCLPLLLLESLTRHLLSPHVGEWQGSADLLAGLVFYPVYGAALILYLDTRTRGLTPGAAQLLAMALRLWPALALLTAVSSLLILLGASLFILPGLWLMVRLAFADFLLVHRGDDQSAAGLVRDEAFVLDALERFAHGGAAHVELVGDFHFA